VVGTREVRHRIGGDEGLDVTLEGLDDGRGAADMGVHARHQQLVTAAHPHQRFKVAALERTVAVLHQHVLPWLRCQCFDDRFVIGAAAHARPPQVSLKATVTAVLVAMLSGVEHRNAVRAAMRQQACDVVHGRPQRRLAGVECGQEVTLHVVHQQRDTIAPGAPGATRLRQFSGSRQGVIGDTGQRHQRVPPVCCR